MYVLGIDAGGTKTHCVIADENENILAEGLAGASQHQLFGIRQTEKNLQLAVSAALKEADLTLQDLSYAVLGMSGADGEDDLALLNPAAEKVLPGIPFRVVHDAWIGMYSALKEPFGVVSICGTGAGHAGRNRQGDELTLRNLDYRLGNYGGGGDLVEKALHYAFRSDEGTYEKSALEAAVPPIFGVSTMEDVCRLLKQNPLSDKERYQLPITVFQLANSGDSVCRMLIQDLGHEEGLYAAAVIRRLHMENEQVPVVLIGSLFHTDDPMLLDPFMDAVRTAAPAAYPVLPTRKPVAGAVRMALFILQDVKERK
ncbi:BadF/BadG/BcrA/BcrD ATPase family protein [Suilimivivens sp.]|uniref:BadF/BadG/BcrA/BcrD ATPase family protein n=1 Tax=Suilimivivens sp. TaxID=2981669 RepID=UPI00307834EC